MAKRSPIFENSNFLRATALALSIVTSASAFGVTAKKAKPVPAGNVCAQAFANVGAQEAMLPEKIISKYLHMPFKSLADNIRYLKYAKAKRPRPGTIAVHVEFSYLQDINTMTNDKNLVTSITNKHKELWFDAMEELERRYGGQVIMPGYSDFKTARVLLIPKPPAKSLPAGFKKDLEQIFAKTNGEFSEFIKKSGLNADPSSAVPSVENWFRAGVGETADLAETAARLSRDMAGTNVLRDAADPLLIKGAEAISVWAEFARDEIVQNPQFHLLLDGAFIKDKVLDMVKKTPDSSVIRARLKAKYGADITHEQLMKLQNYNIMIDKFSLGPQIEQRVIASLQKADLGGYSADASGLSAKNRGGAARAVAEGKDLAKVVKLARKNEQEITRVFKEENEPFTAILDKYFKPGVASGDDFAGEASKVVTLKMKEDLVNEVAQLPNPSGWRIAFISDGVRVRDRNMMGAHGEAIEKILRERLEGKVATEKLDQIFFGVDMGGKSIGEGPVKLLMGEGANSQLTKAERAEIRATFREAVEAFNQKPETEPMQKLYFSK